jgi:hypothetical protein
VNIILWIVQGLLAFFCLAGGGFKLAKPDEVAKQAPAISAGTWRVFGVIEVVGAILLILPGALGWMPQLTPIAAIAIALENVILARIYGKQSMRLVAANPLVYAVPIAIVAAVVAVGRFS